MAVVEVDGYRFSGTDAARTLSHAIDLLDAYPAAVHPHQAQRRAAMAAAVAGGDLAAAWSLLLDARADSVSAGALPAGAVGRVDRLNVSDGGVPKLPVTHVEVDSGGVVGDRQAARVHHGRPWQALCLWSREVIDELAAEGHPIAPGSAGENITVAGLHWPDVTPGVRLQIGSDVVCQVMAYALPCKKNARWFSDGDFNRIHHLRGDLSRVYAVVLQPGRIAAGDSVTLEP